MLLDLIRNIKDSDEAIAITKNGVPEAILISMKKFQGLLDTLDLLSNEKQWHRSENQSKRLTEGCGSISIRLSRHERPENQIHPRGCKAIVKNSSGEYETHQDYHLLSRSMLKQPFPDRMHFDINPVYP
ncbi:MAG: type II toxin-antitoxin system Phd/YefM family antitoxin [Deltaproteobacteria bacterium]|nr:type II toxin-antitoxin system Phd/YefM family antitoxin [Deltaproteobacteria bacterium]